MSERVAPAIELIEASKWYGAVIGLNEVTLRVESGITGLLGPNGAGKSTLLKLLTGQLLPSLGTVRVVGRDPWREPGARARIGFSPEVDAFHEESTGRQFVQLLGRLSGLSRAEARRATEAALDRTGMLSRADKPLRGCSKGMRQRIKLAQAIVHDPDVILLDEPLTGIDPPGRLELARLFRELSEEGKTLLISTHILHELESITDRIVLLARGRVVAEGTLGGIRQLLDEHPLTLRITSNGTRRLAGALAARNGVVGLRLPEVSADEESGVMQDLQVKVLRPAELLGELPGLAVRLGIDVERIEALDASVEAIFGYLVGDASFDRSGEQW